MDIKGILHQWFIRFLIRKSPDSAVANEKLSYRELAKGYTNQLLEGLKNEKYTHLL